jgi:hypothetical protein
MDFRRRFVFSAATLFGTWLCLFPPVAARAEVLIMIDKATQQMTVSVDGATRWIWPVSTGRRGYETPAGNFKPFRLEEDHYSKEWDEAPMPHSIFFTFEGHAIHGSFETRNLGRRASHGCVRIAPQNAEKLFTLVKREGLGNSRVVVREDSNAPMTAQRRTPEQDARKMQQTRKPAPDPQSERLSGSPEQAFGYLPSQSQRELPMTIAPPPYIRGRDWN